MYAHLVPHSSQLSVAMPGIFARGYAIPIWVIVRSGDQAAVDLVTSSGRLQVSLDRVLSWLGDPSGSTDDVRRVAAARLWQVAGSDDAPGAAMHLQGEVLPPSNLPASFSAPSFRLGVRAPPIHAPRILT